MGSRSTRLLCGLLLSAIAAGCGNGGAAAPTSTPVSPSSISTPSPIPTVSASPLPECPNTEGGSCLGSLSPGAYTTTKFQPALTYRVPAGWGNFEDLTGNFLLVPPGGHLSGVDPGTSDFIGVYTSVKAETPDCGPAPHVGGSATDIATYFAGHPDLASTTPKDVSIGGLKGVVLDLTVATGSHKNLVCLIVGVAPSGLEHGVSPGTTMRLYLLKYADPLLLGETLAIEIDDVSGGGHLDAYSAVVGRFRFNP